MSRGKKFTSTLKLREDEELNKTERKGARDAESQLSLWPEKRPFCSSLRGKGFSPKV